MGWTFVSKNPIGPPLHLAGGQKPSRDYVEDSRAKIHPPKSFTRTQSFFIDIYFAKVHSTCALMFGHLGGLSLWCGYGGLELIEGLHWTTLQIGNHYQNFGLYLNVKYPE